MKQTIAILIVLLSFNIVQAENRYKELKFKEYKIVNKEFYNVLDDALFYDREHNEFYSEQLTYSVYIQTSDSTKRTFFKIEGWIMTIYGYDLKGYFYYRDHPFFIRVIPENCNLIKETSKTHIFKIDSSIELMNDDRFDQHYYVYYENNFFAYETNPSRHIITHRRIKPLIMEATKSDVNLRTIISDSSNVYSYGDCMQVRIVELGHPKKKLVIIPLK